MICLGGELGGGLDASAGSRGDDLQFFFRVRIKRQLMSDYSSSHGSGSSSNTSASSDSGGLGSAHSDAVSGIATVVSIGTTASSNASRAVISTAATSSRWAWAVVRVASWLAS